MPIRILLLGLLFSLFVFSTRGQENYFQQDLDYKIYVSLDAKNKMLHGFLELEYTNNSPNTLDSIAFHLWPNAYQGDHTALGKQELENHKTYLYFASEDEKGFIDSLDFKVNGQSVKLTSTSNPDIVWILLNESLESGGSISISSPFRVKIPSGQISRLGYTRNAFQITQWYPKPAVYDQKGCCSLE